MKRMFDKLKIWQVWRTIIVATWSSFDKVQGKLVFTGNKSTVSAIK